MRSERSELLRGLRCLLVNPFLNPNDLRGEIQSNDDGDKHEAGMNFGLLVIANSLTRAGADVEILDLQNCQTSWHRSLDDAILSRRPVFVGVGTISVYSFLPTLQILRRVRAIDPSINTVVGGQNAQNLPILLKHQNALDMVDYLICGDGEHAVVDVALAIKLDTKIRARGVTSLSNGELFNRSFTSRVPLDAENSLLDYSLYPNFRHLWPVIEESRGCPFKCDFCANPMQGGAVIQYKNPELLAAEVRHVYQSYNASGELPLVLMTSIFGVRSQIAREFFKLLRKTDLEPRFVASTRVDLDHSDYLDLGAQYFDQMHFGLESASPGVLRRMIKATDPHRYLERARENLQKWRDHGVHTGINFIVGYLGETPSSIEESIGWLKDNRAAISSVWGGALMAYPDSPFSRLFPDHENLLGATREVTSEYCEVLQTWPINPSPTLSYSEILRYVDQIHQLFFEPSQYYHHYKWYVGPDPGKNTVQFLPQEVFQQRFNFRSLGN